MNLDVLQSVTQDDLILDPCPYFHIKDALPWSIYDQLADQYPEQHMTKDAKQHFQARRYRQHELVEETITPLWREFIDYHTSQTYKDRVLDLFAPALEKYYKNHAPEFRRAPVSPRHSGTKGTVQMELQFVMNGLQEDTVRTVHLDNSRELFAGLLYMRKPEDVSTGGDIQVYRKLVDSPNYHGVREVDTAQVEVAGTVPYRANTMILFLNTHDTLHGVTPRQGANAFRRYINIDAHQDRKLFEL